MLIYDIKKTGWITHGYIEDKIYPDSKIGLVDTRKSERVLETQRIIDLRDKEQRTIK